MGNRAIITTTEDMERGRGVYVHWNGGPESVYAVLDDIADEFGGMPRLDGVLPRVAARFTAMFDGWADPPSERHKPNDALSCYLCNVRPTFNPADVAEDNGVYIIHRDTSFPDHWRCARIVGKVGWCESEKSRELDMLEIENEATRARREAYYGDLRIALKTLRTCYPEPEKAAESA